MPKVVFKPTMARGQQTIMKIYKAVTQASSIHIANIIMKNHPSLLNTKVMMEPTNKHQDSSYQKERFMGESDLNNRLKKSLRTKLPKKTALSMRCLSIAQTKIEAASKTIIAMQMREIMKMKA